MKPRLSTKQMAPSISCSAAKKFAARSVNPETTVNYEYTDLDITLFTKHDGVVLEVTEVDENQCRLE